MAVVGLGAISMAILTLSGAAGFGFEGEEDIREHALARFRQEPQPEPPRRR